MNPEKPLNKPKAILFDWDNTLVDTWPTIHAALEETFTTMGHTPWTMDEVKERVHRSMRDAFPAIFGDKADDAANLYQQSFRRMHLERLEALPDAEEVLKLLKNSDMFIGVVSNKTNVNLHKELDHIGWRPYFHGVVGANDAKADKPDPAPIHLVLKGSGITPDPDVWLIGDSITDMECAHNSGIMPLVYGEWNTKNPLFERYPPSYSIPDHTHLLNILKPWVR